ncbi:hypothetical protein BD414DRAFT_243872 [Trametes punicea]|nr:hypothetical protein BD414DRAFT_243872 [Trametes punicea]
METVHLASSLSLPSEAAPTLIPFLTTPHNDPAAIVATRTSTDELFANVAPCPTKSPSGPPNVVEVVIHTTLTIRDFSRYYTVPISDFQPSYVALSDGSLISPAFLPNLRVSESWLVMGGALCMFFLINTYKSFYYCSVVDVKNKSLFYMLSASQTIGLFVSLFFVIADFDPSVDCTASGMIKKAGVLVSTTLLVRETADEKLASLWHAQVPGILGTKAYRCLSSPGFVIIVLGVVRASIIATSAIVLAEYRGGRRFTGTCETVYESPLLPISVALQFVESAFICLCFMWAVYRSYRGPNDLARLSLTVQDDETSTVDMGEKEGDSHMSTTGRRGWWDYVPDATSGNPRAYAPPSPSPSTPKHLLDRFRQWWTGAPILPSTVFQRKPSTPGEFPIPQPRVSSASGLNNLSLQLSTSRERARPSSPPPPSVMERIIRYVPRAELFRNMLKNELFYTALLTAFLLVIAIVMWVGITRHLLLGPNSWIMVDWVMISLCTMHSFSRVAHRHEREAWLQGPANWRRSVERAEAEDRTTSRSKNARRARSPMSGSSDWRRRYRQRGESDGPYSVASRYTFPDASDPIALVGPSRVRSTSSIRSHEGPGATSTSVVSSPMRSMDSVSRPPHAPCDSPAILPSPEYPPTNASTPHSSDSHAMLSRSPSIAPHPRQRPRSAPRSRSRSRAATQGWDRENQYPQDPGPSEAR